MASYTRQSSFSDGDTISASLFNNEYNQLVTAFSYASSGTTGHRHDGTTGEGGNIHTIGDQDFLNKIVVDSTNNRWGFYVQVSSSAVEQIRIQDGAIVPVTDSDIDLGTSSLEFKDLFIDGTASIDSLTLTSGATVTVIFDEDDMSSNSATGLATQQSIKAYVDSQVTGQSLSFSGDSGGSLSIDLDSEALTITGGTGIDTTGSTNDMSIAIDSTVATLTGSQTLTNKTLTAPVISSISNTGTITLPTSTDTLVGRATTDTLTNKTISSASNTITVNLGSATVTGTLAQFNSALSDGSFVSLTGSETLTNKTLTSPVITTPQINDTSANHQYVFAASELAADRTVTLPLLAGNDTFVFQDHTQTLTNKTLTAPVISTISNSGTVTLPTGSTTLVGTGTSDVLTNKTISGSSNTLSNIGNSSLSNSSVSFGGISVSLGGSDATPAFDLSDATGYTGDSNLVTTGTITSGVWQGTAVADAYVANDLTISGGTVNNTVIGGTTAAAGTFTSLAIDNITIDGTEIDLSSGDLTIDVAGDIILDADGGDFIFVDGGTNRARVKINDSSNVDFEALTADHTMRFRGVDGSSTITALTLDMSEAGAAAFNAGATFNGSVGIGTSSPDSTLHVHAASAGSVTALSGTNLTVEGNANNYLSLLSPDANLSALVYGSPSSTNNASINSSYDSGSPYLNFNTGGSEAMRIDSSQNVGIGTTSTSSIRLQAVTPTANHVAAQIENSNTADSFGLVVKGGNDANDYTADFRKRDNTNIMRIRGDGNVGIGTTSPNVSSYDANASALTISGTNRGLLELRGATGANSTQLGAIRFLSGSTSEADIICELDSSGDGLLTFDTNGSERLRIDSSGRVGVGVTPESWAATFTPVQVGAAASFVGSIDTSNARVVANAYWDTTDNRYEYINSDFASAYNQVDSEHQWLIAASGTADAAISFTQAMTLDASGNLGIGTTSPASELHVKGATPDLRVENTTASETVSLSLIKTATKGFSINNKAISGTNYLTFNLDTAGAGTDAMVIHPSSGNVGIGSTSPAELITLDKSSGDTFVRFDKSGTIKGLVGISDSSASGSSSAVAGDIILRSQTRVLLDTGGTTRAVVDASGNVGIGTASPSSRLTVSGSFDATSAGSKPSITGAGNYGGGIGFIDTNVSGMYTDTSGANLKFFTNQSSSDTAASKVAMTIDGSSNLLVGRTSTLNAGQASILGAASKQALTLQVTSDGNSLIQGFDSSGNLEFQVTGGGAVSTGGQLSIATTGAGNSLGCFLNQGTGANFYEASDGTKTMIAGTDGSQTFVKLGSLSNHSVGLVTNNTERVSIDTSGKVGIGISSPSTDALHVVASGLDDDDDTIVLGANFSSATTLGSIGTHHEDVNNGGLKFSSKTSGTLTEYMRLDASGNVLVGKSGAGSSNVGVELRQAGYIFGTGDGINPLRLNRKTSDGMIADFQKDGTSVGSIGSISSDLYIAEGNSGLRFDGENNQILPASTTASTDGTCNLGAGSARFDDIFATNGTIQTSDRNEKQDIEALSDAEQRVAVAAKGLLRKFRWKTAVTEKGNDARIHFGIIAQDLQAAFEAEGLDAGRYAMFINSTWTDEETGEERSRMGVRYSELLAFIIAAI